MEAAGIDLKRLAQAAGCPFKGPFYQLLRQYLLAAYARGAGGFAQVYVACASFRGNQSLKQVPADFGGAGSTIAQTWNRSLAGAPPLVCVGVEDITARIGSNGSKSATELALYLEDRYGL